MLLAEITDTGLGLASHGLHGLAHEVADADAGAEGAGMVRTTMFLGIAFVEALALIGFVVFFLGQA